MVKKVLKISSVTILIIGLFVLFGFYTYAMATKNDHLLSQLKSYEEKNEELKSMQKTLTVCYNLTPYEARYYSFIFDDFSQKYNIPWEVYPALIKIESNFNSGIMSKQRAKGITQVLESTGKAQADKLGIPFNDGTLWNCVLNMVIGFDYFSEGFAEKIDSTSRDLALKHAIRRYCGGPGYDKIKSDARIYVKEYKSTVWDEYLKVSYIYKGIKYDQLIARQDSLNWKKPINASVAWPLVAMRKIILNLL